MTPRLRFQEFTDEWQIEKLKDVAEVVTGSTPSTVDRTLYGDEFFFVSPGDMNSGRYVIDTKNKLSKKGFEKSRLVPAGSTLFVCIGSTIGKTAQAVIDCTTNQQINSVIANDDYNDDFVYLALDRQASKISLLAGEQAVPLISKGEFQKTQIRFPSKSEQQKIADYLGGVDSKLTSIQTKVAAMHEYKKGVMQALFSGKLRFKDENGDPYPDWEEKRLGDVFSERTERSGQGEMLSVTIGSGIVPFSSLTRKDNSSSDKSNYKCVKIEDIAYNSMRMWQGASGVSEYDGIVSPAYTVITPKEGNDSRFWGYRFKTTDATNTFQRYSQGLTSDTWNLKFNTLSKISFMTPCYDEQQKIADFLSALDDKIKLEEANLARAKEFKKALLQRMFV